MCIRENYFLVKGNLDLHSILNLCSLIIFLIFSTRLTCAFLACKVDEFNVSSPQFVGNLRESPLGQEKALEQILEYELLLIQQLNFHLIVHNPYRPFEGFLIDLKVILLL